MSGAGEVGETGGDWLRTCCRGARRDCVVWRVRERVLALEMCWRCVWTSRLEREIVVGGRRSILGESEWCGYGNGDWNNERK
jgi:hypothetical protein